MLLLCFCTYTKVKDSSDVLFVPPDTCVFSIPVYYAAQARRNLDELKRNKNTSVQFSHIFSFQGPRS